MLQMINRLMPHQQQVKKSISEEEKKGVYNFIYTDRLAAAVALAELKRLRRAVPVRQQRTTRRITRTTTTTRRKKIKRRRMRLKQKLLSIWHHMILFPVRRVWRTLFTRFLNSPKKGLLKLEDDVQTCQYQDIQVMWDILQNNRKGISHTQKPP